VSCPRSDLNCYRKDIFGIDADELDCRLPLSDSLETQHLGCTARVRRHFKRNIFEVDRVRRNLGCAVLLWSDCLQGDFDRLTHGNSHTFSVVIAAEGK